MKALSVLIIGEDDPLYDYFTSLIKYHLRPKGSGSAVGPSPPRLVGKGEDWINGVF